MPAPIPARLFGLLARKAPVGVLLRRGPSDWVRLIRWNTRTDRIQRGQWLHAHVYARRCDLSPDGSLLIYFCRDGRTKVGNYTAISRPPWFTALALWPQGHTWRGGGLFLDDTTVFLHSVGTIEPLPDKRPRGLRVVHEQPYGRPGNSEDLGVYYPRLIRDGWKCVESRRVTRERTMHTRMRKHPDAHYRLIKRVYCGTDHAEGAGCYWDEYAIEAAGHSAIAGADWADFDQRGRLVFTRDGCLWEAMIKGGSLQERLIADFNTEEPQAIAAPASARRW